MYTTYFIYGDEDVELLISKGGVTDERFDFLTSVDKLYFIDGMDDNKIDIDYACDDLVSLTKGDIYVGNRNEKEEVKPSTITVNQLKNRLLNYCEMVVNENNNKSLNISDNFWKENIKDHVVNDNIEGFEADIKHKFIDNPYLRYNMSEKQAYCLARAFQRINTNTIKL